MYCDCCDECECAHTDGATIVVIVVEGRPADVTAEDVAEFCKLLDPLDDIKPLFIREERERFEVPAGEALTRSTRRRRPCQLESTYG